MVIHQDNSCTIFSDKPNDDGENCDSGGANGLLFTSKNGANRFWALTNELTSHVWAKIHGHRVSHGDDGNAEIATRPGELTFCHGKSPCY